MNKLLVTAFALTAGLGAAFALANPSPAERACQGLADACGSRFDVDECEEDLEGASEEELADIVTCVEPAENCIEVTACLTGAVLRDLGEGLERGLFETR